MEQIAKARALYADGELEEALAEAKRAVEIDGRSKDAHFLAGEILSSIGDLKSAFVEYEWAGRLDPTDSTARFRIIDALVDANLLDVAAVRINAALGDRPGDVDAIARRALIEARQGAGVKARVDASAVLASAPGNALGNAVMAELALDGHQIDAALAAVRRGLADHPTDAPLLRLKARCTLAWGTPAEAIDAYRAIIQSVPRSVRDRAALSEIQADAGAIDAGEQTLRDGVAAAPQSKPMRLQLATYLLRRRGPGAAEAELKAAVATKPADPDYDLALADVLARGGRLADATQVLETAVTRLEGNPTKATAEIGLARTLAAGNRPEVARRLLDGLIKAEPTKDEALLLRAALMLQAHETAGAVVDLLAVTGRRPADPAPFLLLAQAYEQGGHTDEAVDALKRVADLNPANPQAVTGLVDLCRRVGRPDCARRAVADYAARNPATLQGLAALVRLSMADKDWPTVRATLAKLRQLPNGGDVATALAAESDEAQGKFAEAAAGYRRLIASPSSSLLNRAAAEAYVRTALAANQGLAAVDALSAIARSTISAVGAPAGVVLSGLYQKLGRSAEALSTIEAAIKARPDDPAGYLQKAFLLRQAQRAAEATQALTAGIAAGAPAGALLPARAELEQSSGHPDAAIETYQAVLDADPRSIVAANNLASLLADRTPLDRDRLVKARDRLAQLPNGNNGSILDTLAWTDYRLGDYAAAKAILLRAEADKTAMPQLRFHLGAVLMALGEKDSGRALIKTVLNQDFPGRQEAERLAVD